MATAFVSITPECSICCESFKTPKVLLCGHTFCLCCIERYISDKTKNFPCPICQQDVKIPKGGAKMFTTNFILETSKHTTQVRDQSPSTPQPKCHNHNQRVVDYYCNNCNVGLCFRCISKQHKDHETLDIECEETRNEAIEKLELSQKIIQNKIKNLKKTQATLLESFELLKTVCEDSCAQVTEKTEQIVSDLQKRCEKIKKDIRKSLEKNRSKVEDREKEITSDINLLESNINSIISPSSKTTLNILLTLPRLLEIEKLGERRTDYDLCIQYLQWVGKDFSLDIYKLGSVISKPFYIPGLYQFLFNVSDIEEDATYNYCKNKFRNYNLVWSCYARSCGDDLGIGIKLLRADNPELNYCILDGTISLLNIYDDSKTITRTVSDMTFERGDSWWWYKPITWSKLTDKNNGYLNSNGQFVIQFDNTLIGNIIMGKNKYMLHSY